MDLEFYELLVLVGVIQAVFIILLLLTSPKYTHKANRLFALALLGLVLIILRISILSDNDIIVEIFEYARLEYLFPLLLFMYAHECINEKIPLPMLIGLTIPFITFSIIHTLISIADFQDYHRLADILERVEPYEFYATISFQLFLFGWILLKVHQSTLMPHFKMWLLGVFLSFIFIDVAWIIVEWFEVLLEINYHEIIISIISIFFIGVSYAGVHQFDPIFLEKDTQQPETPSLALPTNNPLPPPTNTPSSKQNDPIIPSENFLRLEQLMTQNKLFKNANLNRELLASNLALSPSTITRLVKQHTNKSLTDYINQYRINLAQQMLSDPEFNIYSVQAIGLEVGFKSRSAFYNAFKKTTGFSPGEFKKQAKMS